MSLAAAQTQTPKSRSNRIVLARRATLLVALVFVLAACSDDRPLQYLQSQAEDTLAYPGAELTCTIGDSATGLSATEPATSEHCYTARATEDEVVAWYAEELASRGWRREGQNLPALPELIPRWDKGFVTLQLREFLQAPDGLALDAVTYSVVTAVRVTAYDEAPIARLELLPEASLALPGSTDPSPTRHGRTTTSDSIHAAYIEGAYRTVASAEEIVRFYEAELAARHWQPIDISEAHNGIGTLPARAWRKGDVVAHITTNPKPAGNPATMGYRFRIIEILGPEQLPGFPWR